MMLAVPDRSDSSTLSDLAVQPLKSSLPSSLAGPGYAAAVLLPLFSSAAGATLLSAGAAAEGPGPEFLLGRPVPPHLRDTASDLAPKTPEAAKLAR